MIIKANDIQEELMHGYRHGKKRATTTHIPEVDKAWRWREGDLTIWTGYQNEGKSLFLEQLMALKSALEGWTHCIFSPENTPATDYFDNIIEMLVGKSCDPFYEGNLMSESQYLNAIQFVNKHFYLTLPDGQWSVEAIHTDFEQAIRDFKIKNLVYDPYNKIMHDMGNERGDIYVSNFMTTIKRFAVKHQVSSNLVAHQLTAQKDEQGRYVKPDLNRIKGGGAFSDGADHVCYVWRPDRATDFSSTLVQMGSQKIKKQKLVAIPSDVYGIGFSRKKNRYSYNGRDPFEKVDRMRLFEKSTEYKPNSLNKFRILE